MTGGYFDSRRDGGTLELELRGQWRAASLVAIREEQSRLDFSGVRHVSHPRSWAAGPGRRLGAG
jgi:hypothetical protein